jgi:hypothetical protein
VAKGEKIPDLVDIVIDTDGIGEIGAMRLPRPDPDLSGGLVMTESGGPYKSGLQKIWMEGGQNVARGFNLVLHDCEGSHYEIWR